MTPPEFIADVMLHNFANSCLPSRLNFFHMKLAEKHIGLQTNVSWFDLTSTEIERLLSTRV